MAQEIVHEPSGCDHGQQVIVPPLATRAAQKVFSRSRSEERRSSSFPLSDEDFHELLEAQRVVETGIRGAFSLAASFVPFEFQDWGAFFF